MSAVSILNTLLNIAQIAKIFPSPATQAVAAIAHILQTEVLTPTQLENKIPRFIDKDEDSIDDAVDPDRGKVCAVTDEMIHAGQNELDKSPTINLAAIYLAMYAARPKPIS